MQKLEGLDLEGKQVLDAGTGACGMTKYLEKEGAEVISIDLEKEYLKECRRQTDSPQFLRADLSDLDTLKSETFDYVVCNFLVSALAENKDLIVTSVFREFERILGKDGTLIVIEYYPFSEERSPAPLDPSHVKLWRLENAVSELLGQGHLEEYSPATLKEELTSLGFQNVRTRTLLEEVPWPTDLLKEHESLIREMLADLDSDHLRNSLRKSLEDIMEEAADKKVESGAIYELRAEK